MTVKILFRIMALFTFTMVATGIDKRTVSFEVLHRHFNVVKWNVSHSFLAKVF